MKKSYHPIAYPVPLPGFELWLGEGWRSCFLGVPDNERRRKHDADTSGTLAEGESHGLSNTTSVHSPSSKAEPDEHLEYGEDYERSE